jgi:hypothetical protein
MTRLSAVLSLGMVLLFATAFLLIAVLLHKKLFLTFLRQLILNVTRL